jgi:hypothetical protein
MGFADATGAKQQQGLSAIQPAGVMGALLDLGAVQLRDGVPVVLGQGFGNRQLGFMQ